MNTLNAKEELTEALDKICWNADGQKRTVICAKITYGGHSKVQKKKDFILPLCHSDEIWVEWLESLDFQYEHQYTAPEEYQGTLWLSDGTWIVRDEHNELGYWRHVKAPQIPIELINH